MDERHLLLIAFMGSLIGLFSLYIISQNLDIQEKSIADVVSEQLKDMVKVKGRVQSVYSGENVTILSIVQPTTITVVVFDNISISADMNVEVIGQVEEYKGNLEIIGHRIRTY